MSEVLDAIALAFKEFDASMDEILDLVQEQDMQGAITAGLAIRLVSYATQAPDPQAEAIALSLCRELATMRRQMKQGMTADQ